MTQAVVMELEAGDVVTLQGLGSARVTRIEPASQCYPGRNLMCVYWERIETGQFLSHDHLSPYQVVGEKA